MISKLGIIASQISTGPLPIHKWIMDETSGTTIYDSGSNPANGTISGNYNLNQTVSSKTCIQFLNKSGGNNSRLDCTDLTDCEFTYLSNFSAFAWIYTSINTGFIVGKNYKYTDNLSAVRGWRLMFGGWTSGKLEFILDTRDPSTGAGNMSVWQFSSTVNDSAWHHVGFTYAGHASGTGSATITLYLDGSSASKSVPVNNVGTGNIVATTAPVTCATFDATSPTNNTNRYEGYMRDVRIYDSVLTSQNVSDVYNGLI